MASGVVESSPPLSKVTAFGFTSTAAAPLPDHMHITCVPVHYRWRAAAWQAAASSARSRTRIWCSTARLGEVDGAGGAVLVPGDGLQVDSAHGQVYCNVIPKIGSMAV